MLLEGVLGWACFFEKLGYFSSNGTMALIGNKRYAFALIGCESLYALSPPPPPAPSTRSPPSAAPAPRTVRPAELPPAPVSTPPASRPRIRPRNRALARGRTTSCGLCRFRSLRGRPRRPRRESGGRRSISSENRIQLPGSPPDRKIRGSG